MLYHCTNKPKTMFATITIRSNFETNLSNTKKENTWQGIAYEKIHIFAPFGEMAEWSKAHAWKVCNRQKRFMGSNPILSAIFFKVIRYFNSIYVLLMGKKLNFDFMVIFGLLMVIMYVGMGFYFLLYSGFNAKFNIPPEYNSIRIFFGIFLVAYGFFRFVRIYPKLKNKKDYEND